MHRKILLFLSLITLPTAALLAQVDPPRERARLDDDWRFSLGDPADAQKSEFNDASWRAVTLPHDWSIEGRIDPKAPTGAYGGYFPTGIGWYRHHFEAPAAWKGKQVTVEFEGVYMDSDVFLNGRKLATQHYGYTTFFVDLTPALQIGAPNVLAVRVDNSQQRNTRWYSGSGIYRHVWLTVTNPIHLAAEGVFVSTPKVDPQAATVAVQATVQNGTDTAARAVVHTTVIGPDGAPLGQRDTPCDLPAHGSQTVPCEIPISHPPLWSPETPQLCRLQTEVRIGNQPADVTSTPFGVRVLAWSPETGLTLNGKTYKLSGGCIHHDNGVLGACAFDRAEERKVGLLKAAGFNAIRTSHNPPSPAMLDACDRLGMLVMDEAFDCWANGKNTKDYSIYFKADWPHDLEAMIRRDRNHPSIVLWSTGNEIPGVFDKMGLQYGPKLVATIRALDSTRPVSEAISAWPVDTKKPAPTDAEKHANADKMWDDLDIVGSNYTLHNHVEEHDKYPRRVLVSSESYPPSGPYKEVLDHPYIVGDFVWTAMDYFGESGLGRTFFQGDPTVALDTPRPTDPPGMIRPVGTSSDRLFPWHGSDCGDLDILGNAKPAAHLRNIQWGMGDKLALAVRQPEDGKKMFVTGWGSFPTWESWTWPGEEGKPLQVEVYSRYEKVRLYLNDKPVGEAATTRAQNFAANFKVPYAAGTLRAVGLENGREVGDVRLTTAGAAAGVRLTPDRTNIHADGQDLSFVAVEIVDKEGRLQPNGDGEVVFDLKGPGLIAGLGNAWSKSEDPYQGDRCHVYHGRALVVVRARREAGPLTLTARCEGLATGEAHLQTSMAR